MEIFVNSKDGKYQGDIHMWYYFEYTSGNSRYIAMTEKNAIESTIRKGMLKMKKKLVNLGLEIAGSPIIEGKQREKLVHYESDGKYYVFDRYRILQTEERVPGTELEEVKSTREFIGNYIRSLSDWNLDYQAMDISSVEEIKEGIRECCGRKLDRVAFCLNGMYPTLDARTLWKALYALNARKIFVANVQDYRKRPVFILENDDPQSENVFMLLPIHNFDGRTGYWKA